MARKKTAPAPATLTLGQLLDKLIEAKMPFSLHHWPDATDGTWGCKIADYKEMGDDPVTVVLGAVAEGVSQAEKTVAEGTKILEVNRQRLASIRASIPDLHVHRPEGEMCECGRRHKAEEFKGAVVPRSIGELVKAMSEGRDVKLDIPGLGDVVAEPLNKKESAKKKGN